MIVINKNTGESFNLSNKHGLSVDGFDSNEWHIVAYDSDSEELRSWVTIATYDDEMEALDRWLDMSQCWAVGQSIYYTDQPLVDDSHGYTEQELTESLEFLTERALDYYEEGAEDSATKLGFFDECDMHKERLHKALNLKTN